MQINLPEGDRESRGEVVWGMGQESGIGHSGLVPWEPTEREFRLTGRAGKAGKREEDGRNSMVVDRPINLESSVYPLSL